MMIPITRKEKYINEIVGGGDTAPKTPQTREEFFFAEILGEVIAPSPVTRVEKYLSVIAGQYSGELPEPVTRIEKFIARAAGMDVTIPTPITREEMLWANYALIVEKELSGIPPLTYKAIEGTLKNYRIYGQTVDGESVGDRTGNLFEAELVNYNISANGQISALTDFILSIAPVIAGTTYTISNNQTTNVYAFYQQYPKPERYSYNSSRYVFNENSITIVAPIDGYIVVRKAASGSPIMLNAGSTPLPYEPYGYKVPIAVTNSGTTSNETIYLPEPIKMVGDEAEYIDYAEQKMHRIGADDIDVTLPELPVLPGTNTLTVGTEVQPSNVYIKYEGAR